MLAGKGYQVYNISGGINKWDSQAAYGLPEQDLELFTGHESPQKTLNVAFALEEGLHEFYLSMAARAGFVADHLTHGRLLLDHTLNRRFNT